jgi:NADPH:quinone reductase-like Zn-dependent oxidoreductase
MKAIVQEKYGSPDVLHLTDIETPEPGPDQLLVRVRAAGVDPGVCHLMAGLPYAVRVMGFGLRAPKTPVRGADFAGEVAALGANVTGLQVGDAVYGSCLGAFAEYALARPDRVLPKPERLSLVEAAALPTGGYTALQGLRDAGKIQPGQRVMVIGAGGGVGTLAVQLAKAFGTEVTGVCATDKVELVRSLGADDVIDYTTADLADRGRHDLILDTAGNRPLQQIRPALAAKGTLVIIGGEGGGPVLGGMTRQLWGAVLGPVTGQRVAGTLARPNEADLRLLTEFVEAGKLTPVVDRTYPLDQAADAVRHLAEGHSRGRTVLTL